METAADSLLRDCRTRRAADRQMRTGLPDIYAAGDCVITHHRLLGETYLPLGTTAIFHSMTVDAISDLDLSYTPPLGSPWDAVQAGAQAWTRYLTNRTSG